MKKNALKFVEKSFSPNLYLVGKSMTQEKTNRNYKDSVFVDFLCRFSDKKIEKNNRLHEW